MTIAEPVLVRRADERDQAYVESTWWHSLIGDGVTQRRDAKALVGALLENRDTRVKIAAEQGDPTRIVGWIAYVDRPAVLHYVYVRASHRGFGVGRMLVDSAGLLAPPALVYTMRGPSARWLLEKHTNLVHVKATEFVL